jgi:hypothetical protein
MAGAIRWAPTLPMALIGRLYRVDAEGREEADLLDDMA